MKALYIDDMSETAIAQLEEKMRPGKSSRAGFLGPDESLREVIEGDLATLNKLGITPKQIADRLETIIGKALRLRDLKTRTSELSNYFVVEGKFSVNMQGYLGMQECPFRDIGDMCGSGSRDYEIYNEDTDEQIFFPALIIHLIRDHHFFEGNTMYRLDPAKAVNVLEIEPGVDYTPQFTSEFVWRQGSSTPNIDENFLNSDTLIQSAEKHIEIAPGVDCYVKENKAVIVARQEHALGERFLLDGNELDLYAGRIRQGRCGLNLIERTFISPD